MARGNWSKECCEQCGEEGLASRGNKDIPQGPYVCDECESWDKAYKQGVKDTIDKIAKIHKISPEMLLAIMEDRGVDKKFSDSLQPTADTLLENRVAILENRLNKLTSGKLNVLLVGADIT